MKALVTLVLLLVTVGPPSGRPPQGPLERYDARRMDFKYDITMSTMVPYGQDDPTNPVDPRETDPRIGYGGTFELRDTPIVMPLIFQGAYSRTDPESIAATLWLGDHEDKTVSSRVRVDSGAPHHTHLAVIPIVEFSGKIVRWTISYDVITWSSRIDDQQAARIPWPREWPKEVADGLRPQMFIESDDPIFKETVDRISEGKLRLVPPYLAAKDIVRYCIKTVRVSGDGLDFGRMGILHGMEVVGALETAEYQEGGPHDLVCVCVAMLRAAGIPSRPVIGIDKDRRGRRVLVTWAEFYLPDAGWIPFDPYEMRGKGIINRDVRQPWGEFGTMKDLNKRVPLSYHFIPPRAVESPQRPAAWGWDPRPNGAPSAEQRIIISTVSRGPVKVTDEER